MITLLRNKRKLYLCNVSLNNEIKRYSEPIKLYENYQITDTKADVDKYGLDCDNHIRIKTDISHKDYYHVGDRVYINTEPPQVHDPLCKTADYEVEKPPKPTLNELEVILRRIGGKK